MKLTPNTLVAIGADGKVRAAQPGEQPIGVALNAADEGGLVHVRMGSTVVSMLEEKSKPEPKPEGFWVHSLDSLTFKVERGRQYRFKLLLCFTGDDDVKVDWNGPDAEFSVNVRVANEDDDGRRFSVSEGYIRAHGSGVVKLDARPADDVLGCDMYFEDLGEFEIVEWTVPLAQGPKTAEAIEAFKKMVASRPTQFPVHPSVARALVVDAAEDARPVPSELYEANPWANVPRFFPTDPPANEIRKRAGVPYRPLPYEVDEVRRAEAEGHELKPKLRRIVCSPAADTPVGTLEHAVVGDPAGDYEVVTFDAKVEAVELAYQNETGRWVRFDPKAHLPAPLTSDRPYFAVPEHPNCRCVVEPVNPAHALSDQVRKWGEWQKLAGEQFAQAAEIMKFEGPNFTIDWMTFEPGDMEDFIAEIEQSIDPGELEYVGRAPEHPDVPGPLHAFRQLATGDETLVDDETVAEAIGAGCFVNPLRPDGDLVESAGAEPAVETVVHRRVRAAMIRFQLEVNAELRKIKAARDFPFGHDLDDE